MSINKTEPWYRKNKKAKNEDFVSWANPKNKKKTDHGGWIRSTLLPDHNEQSQAA